MDKSAFLREVRMIEFSNRWLWQFIRPFVRSNLARRCENCVIPDSYRSIGADGLCRDCREMRPEDSWVADAEFNPSQEVEE
ncbi:MAG: hypothetical protein ACLFWD_04090, partial [Anaerolineales bacterium]